MSTRFSRRLFTRATGIGAGLLPLLSTGRRKGSAWAATGPKRFVGITWSNGVFAGEWYPDCIQWHEGGDKHKNGSHYLYDPGAGATSTSFTLANRRISASMEPFKSDLIFTHGIDLGSFSVPGHESGPSLLSGVGYRHIKGLQTAWSIDQLIGDQAARTTSLPFRTLNLAVQPRDGRGVIWRAGQQIAPETDPYRLFEQAFGGRAVDSTAFERQRAGRLSIMDFVGKELTDFEKRLGTDDRRRVELHLQSVREMERRLTAAAAPTGKVPTPASLPGTKFDSTRTESFDKTTRAFMDLIVLALASDLTRAATLQLSDGDGNNLLMPWLGKEFEPVSQSGDLGNQSSQHTAAHAENLKYLKMQTWLTEQFSYLVQRLKETPDPLGGTLLQNTIVYFVNTMSMGDHETTLLPLVLAGQCGGFFKTGRYLKLPKGTTQNQVLISIANAMDVPITQIGDAQQGPLAILRS